MLKDITEADVLRTTVLNKAQRGNYLNVRRTIMDLNNINDYEADLGCKESTTELLKMMVTQKTQEDTVKEDVLLKVMDRLDQLDAKLEAAK